MSLLQTIERVRRALIERRRSIRQDVLFPAWIDVAEGSQRHNCTVLDISEGGARITLSSAAELPDEFWLALTEDGTRRRRCRMAWRADEQIGVNYLGPLQTDFFPPAVKSTGGGNSNTG